MYYYSYYNSRNVFISSMMWRSRRHLLTVSRPLLLIHKRSFGNQQRNNRTVKLFREMPGPSLLANVIKYTGRSMDRFHRDIFEGFEKYGPVYKFNLPGFKLVLACDPKDIEHVFRNEDRPAVRGVDSSFAKYFVAKGMKEGISGEDESWYTHRKTTAPNMLLPFRNKGYIPGKGPSTNRFRSPIADLFRDDIHPLSSIADEHGKACHPDKGISMPY